MKIKISNLASDVTEQDLRQLLEPFGEIASVSIDHERGGRETVAYADTPDQHAAEAIVRGLKGKNLKGKPMQFPGFRSRRRGEGGSRRHAGDRKGGSRGGRS